MAQYILQPDRTAFPALSLFLFPYPISAPIKQIMQFPDTDILYNSTVVNDLSD